VVGRWCLFAREKRATLVDFLYCQKRTENFLVAAEPSAAQLFMKFPPAFAFKAASDVAAIFAFWKLRLHPLIHPRALEQVQILFLRKS